MNTKRQLFTGMLLLLTQLFFAQNDVESTQLNYCASTNVNPAGQYITEVGFAGVRNVTTYKNGYEFYEFDNINVRKGPYTNLNEAGLIHIKVKTAWENTKVAYWVDWNQDGDFDDASETNILTNVNNPTKNEWLEYFRVPESGKLGKTRMRVRAVYADEINPCGDEWFGETEDYTINVVEPRIREKYQIEAESIYCESTNGNPGGQHITEVAFAGVKNVTRYNYGYDFYEFENVNINVRKGPYTNLNEPSVIEVKVKQAWENTKVAYWADWNQDGDFDDALEQRILTRPENPTKNQWTEFLIIPDSAKLGETRLRVRAVYADEISPCGDEWFGETEDYIINVVEGRTRIDMVEAIQKITAFPNPSSTGNFTLSFNEPVSNITLNVFNNNGILIRSLSNQDTFDNKLSIDLSDLNAGIYMVQTIMDQGVETTRLVIQ